MQKGHASRNEVQHSKGGCRGRDVPRDTLVPILLQVRRLLAAVLLEDGPRECRLHVRVGREANLRSSTSVCRGKGEDFCAFIIVFLVAGANVSDSQMTKSNTDTSLEVLSVLHAGSCEMGGAPAHFRQLCSLSDVNY